MPFISYAQNREDVMLWRALKHVSQGFYIDAGANDPTEDSVTKAFYDRGWHGINIEPVRHHYEDLVRQRPRDVNLNCAVGSQEGAAEILDTEIRGWATLSDNVKAKLQSEGQTGVTYKVAVRPLTDICAENHVALIHFLKIDVEGYEKEALLGLDLERYRPWIAVVEATAPNSRVEAHEEWEHILTSKGYEFVYFDAVNRFYICPEHIELAAHFRLPPNVLDDYMIGHHYIALEKLNAAEQAGRSAREAEACANEARRAAESMKQQLEERAEQAERRAERAEARAESAEIRGSERAEQAERRAERAEARAESAEIRGSERAEQAERCAERAVAIERAAEHRAGEAEDRARRAEGEAREATRSENEWRARVSLLEKRSKDLVIECETSTVRANQAELRADASEANARRLGEELCSIYASKSWRIVRVVRTIRHLRGAK